MQQESNLFDRQEREAILQRLNTRIQHDDKYAVKEHNHDDKYADKEHNHDDKYADKEHKHKEYSLVGHKHDDKADVNHKHSEYSLEDHKHSEYSNKDHKHPDYVDLMSSQVLHNKTLFGPIIKIPEIRNVEVKTDDWVNYSLFELNKTRKTHYSLGNIRVYFLTTFFSVTGPADHTMQHLCDIRAYGPYEAGEAIARGRGFFIATSNMDYTVRFINLDLNSQVVWKRMFPYNHTSSLQIFCMYFL